MPARPTHPHPDRSAPSRRAPRVVQGIVHSANFPRSLDDLVVEINGTYNVEWSPVAEVLRWQPSDDFTWSAAAGLGEGDLLFFHLATRARAQAASLRRAAARDGLLDDPTDGEAWARHFAAATATVERYAGAVYAIGVLDGPPVPDIRERASDARYWRARLQAPVGRIVRLRCPVMLRDLEPVVPRPHKAVTELPSLALRHLLTAVAAAGNRLPAAVAHVEPAREDFADVGPRTWRRIACAPDRRFRSETVLREVFADYLLAELRDPGTVVYEEIRCAPAPGPAQGALAERSARKAARRSPGTTSALSATRASRARADYLVRIGGVWVPVEAKLSLWQWPDLLEQVAQYTGAGAYLARARSGTQQVLDGGTTACLVVDQDGLYVVRDGAFHRSSPGRPLVSRTALGAMTREETRRVVARALTV